MLEQILVVGASLLIGPAFVAGLHGELIALIGALGQAISGRTAWVARLAWALSLRTAAASDSILGLPQPGGADHQQEPKIRRLLLVIGVLITAPVCVGLLLSDFESSRLRFAPWFGVAAGSDSLLPLADLAGAVWALIVVAWGLATFDTAGLIPLAPYHWLRPRLRRCLAVLFSVMLVVSFAAAMLFFELGMAVVERRQPLIPGASAIFNLLFALLLHSSVAVTGWSLPLVLWVAALAAVVACSVVGLVAWALLALLTRGVEEVTVIVARMLDVVARLGRLVWNAFAQSPPGEWVGLSPLDEPTPWSWRRNDVGGPLREDAALFGLQFERPGRPAGTPTLSAI